MSEMKPCPFCGSDDLRNDGANRGIGCRACGAWMPSVISTDKERSHNALDGWNSRTREERLEGLLREARSLLRLLPPHLDLKLRIDAALKEDHGSD